MAFMYGIRISLRQVIKPIMKNKVMREAKAIPALDAGFSSCKGCSDLVVVVDTIVYKLCYKVYKIH
jgi:hypothetical protein